MIVSASARLCMPELVLVPRVAAGRGSRSKHSWEVTDRSVNFDYLDDSRREKLDRLFDGQSLR
jgi:hypothetical protein